MAGLADMEELITRVENADMAGYLREAFTCYGAGAYRGSIVLTFAALFEDIRLKTLTVGKVNATVKTISTQIEALAAGQKPFENQLVDQLKAHDLISELQSQTLKQIVNHRNKAAHPSGHIASAEEARYVFFESIDKFLSQPVLSTSHAVDEILTEIAGANYFPTAQLFQVSNIVKAAIADIHSSAHVQLVARLAPELASSNADTARNARYFLQGLLISDANYWRKTVAAQLLEKKSAETSYGTPIFCMMAVDAKLLISCTPATQARVAKLVADLVEQTPDETPLTVTRHPITLLKAITKDLVDDEIVATLPIFLGATTEKYWHNPALLKAAKVSKVVM